MPELRLEDIPNLSNEDLVIEYGAEVAGEDRRISSDPPSLARELSDEILKRMRPIA